MSKPNYFTFFVPPWPRREDGGGIWVFFGGIILQYCIAYGERGRRRQWGTDILRAWREPDREYGTSG